MKNFKKIIASFAAAAVAATGMFTAIPASAEATEVELEYTGPSAAAYTLSDDGASIRMNLVNEYAGSGVFDLAQNGSFSEKISVTFTVDGLGEDAGYVTEDGTEVDYMARLMGNVGTDEAWADENAAVAIEGDGTYTADFTLSSPCDFINILFLETNINVFNYNDAGDLAASGVGITVDKVTTMADGSVPQGMIGTAVLTGAIGAEEVWSADDATAGSTVANIDGDAQYMVEWVCGEGGGTETLEFLTVQIPGLNSDKYPNLAVTVDELYIDGAPVADYKTSAEAIVLNYYDSATGSTRIYLRDEWAATGVADLPRETTIAESIKVVFTVSGTGVEGTSNMPVISEYELGDATLDGQINLYDAIEIAKYMMGEALDDTQLVYADMTQDGNVNLYDAIAVCNYIMG